MSFECGFVEFQFTLVAASQTWVEFVCDMVINGQIVAAAGGAEGIPPDKYPVPDSDDGWLALAKSRAKRQKERDQAVL